jgi:hypothetical protein
MSDQVQQAWTFAQYDDVEALESLVPGTVNADASTYSRENHIHTLLMSAAVHGSLQAATFLLDNGATVDKRNFLGYTALHWTAFSGRIEAVDLLLDRGADIDAQTEDGKTVVHIAASRGHLQYLYYIIKKGADIHAVTSIGWSAVHFSVIGNFRKVCQFFLGKGVDYRSLDLAKKTVWDVAEKYGRPWANELLPKGGAKEAVEEEDAPEPAQPKSTKNALEPKPTPKTSKKPAPRKEDSDSGEDEDEPAPPPQKGGGAKKRGK